MVMPGALTIADTLGALEIGVMVSSLLYGITCGQVYLYATQSKRRPAILSVIVALVMTLETIHLIFMWIYFFDITVTKFGNPFAIASVTWRYSIMLGAHALLVTIIELFFCYRVWVLSSCSWVALPPTLATLARGGITLTQSVLDMTMGMGIFRHKSSTALFYSALIISAMVDFYITVSLCTLLWNKRTGHQGTIKIVTAIICWTFETGVFITITAMIILVVFTVFPFAGYWNGLLMIYPRLYANSFLNSLDWNSHARARRTTILGDSEAVFAAKSDTILVARSVHTEVADVSRMKQAQGQVPGGNEHERIRDDDTYSEITFVDVDEEDLGTQKIHSGQSSHWSRRTL